ncbi:charged multivesicular body protein 7 [Lutzomyia longipalpis]|uniref:charged multivesicular body protein 7 n=1 Tax=Lutzomyia longipalpis TaxID=7200 RepID=UPI0024838321|nr:charged multivesicular body protein 7 [Lutzomyia longipalpis]
MAKKSEFPADLLPSCWSDDTRMGVLFAPFRERSVNPENFDGKMKFWKEMISKYCHWRGTAKVTIMDVEESLTRNGKKSYCLDKVFEDMQKERSLRVEQDFMEPPQHTWLGWTTNLLVKTPVKKGLSAAKNALFPTNYKEVAFVVLEVVENHASMLQNLMEGRILSQKDVVKEAEEKFKLTPEGISLAIHALHCQQKVAIRRSSVESVENPSQGILLKFVYKDEKKILEISDLEYSIYELESREKELTAIMDELEKDVKEEDEKARENARKGNRSLAKLYLRKRKILTNKLDKHTNTLVNIQELLSKIHDVSHNQKIMQTYKLGGKAFRDALEKSGVTLEMVQETVDEIRDAIELSDDIERVLGEDLSGDSSDNTLLEEELDLLLKEDKNEEVPAASGGAYDDLFLRLEALKIPDDTPSYYSRKQTETSQ